MEILHDITPASVGWQYLSASVYRLGADEEFRLASDSHETVLVLVAGVVTLSGGIEAALARRSPFVELASVAYVPPGAGVTVTAHADSEIAVGMAPAEGRFPARLVQPHEMATEVRGGDGAMRQVVDSYGPAFEAERIISYEAWVPRSGWTGWPPHRHDGLDGSPYLEETYYYRFDRPGGFGVHRNFDLERGREELFPLVDGTLVPVPRDYHLCAVGPPANAWLVNFLAGAPDDRMRPPCFDERELWITAEWDGSAPSQKMVLPAVDPG